MSGTSIGNGLFDSLRTLERSLDYHLERQQVLTSNIANAETPGYRPLDVSFQATLERASAQGAGGASPLAVTDPGHLPQGPVAKNGGEVFEDPVASPGNDGNAVSVDREMAKLAANSIRYRAAAEMISRRLGMLKYAASDGQRR